MPSIAQAVLEPVCGKKRRRDEGDTSGVQMMKMSTPRLNRHSPLTNSTQIFNGQIRDDTIQGKEGLGLEQRHLIPKSLRFHESSKRQRIERLPPSQILHLPLSESSHDSYFLRQPGTINLHTHTEAITSPIAEEVKLNPKVDLSPCHICHRKPTARHELDAFADCEGCGKRTCWICIRECLGLGFLGSSKTGLDDSDMVGNEKDLLGFSFEGVDAKGASERVGRSRERERIGAHMGMVCSRCCVERGTEGEVWCLGCLRSEGGS